MKHLNKLLAILLLCVLASCGSTKEADPIALLTSKNWELQSLNGNAANASQYGRGLPTVTFSADNKIMGNGGCNGFSGSYNVNDEMGMNVSQIVSTKMACEGGNGESEFFATLEKANMVKVDADKLTLMNGVDELMVLVPRAE